MPRVAALRGSFSSSSSSSSSSAVSASTYDSAAENGTHLQQQQQQHGQLSMSAEDTAGTAVNTTQPHRLPSSPSSSSEDSSYLAREASRTPGTPDAVRVSSFSEATTFVTPPPPRASSFLHETDRTAPRRLRTASATPSTVSSTQSRTKRQRREKASFSEAAELDAELPVATSASHPSQRRGSRSSGLVTPENAEEEQAERADPPTERKKRRSETREPTPLQPADASTTTTTAAISTTDTEQLHPSGVVEASVPLPARAAPAQRPVRTTPLQPSSNRNTNAGAFDVMLNHVRTPVDRQHPFLNPNTLFTSTPPLHCPAVPDALRVDLIPPVHRYGNRPVLLLDYTGTLHLRRQRRQKQKEIEDALDRLGKKRYTLERSGRTLRMRRLRAQRAHLPGFVAEEFVETTGNNNNNDGNESKDFSVSTNHDLGNHEDRDNVNSNNNNDNSNDGREESVDGVVFNKAHVMKLLKDKASRLEVVKKETSRLKQEHAKLLAMKELSEATHEGCVLMLPSPDTQEVRLCSGHHYRTVCFVGEELRDVVPGEGPVPQVPPSVPISSQPLVSPLNNHAIVERPRRPSRPSRAQSQTSNSTAVSYWKRPYDIEIDPSLPLWAKVELAGYAMFRHVQAFRLKAMQRREGRAGGGGDGDQAEAMMADYLAQPAAAAAVYRQLGMRRFNLQDEE